MRALSSRPRCLATAVALSLCLAGAGAGEAAACTKSWVGAGANNNYATDANWSPAGVPLPGDDVCITAAGTYTVDYSGAIQRSVASLTLGNPSSGTQELLMKSTSTSGDARLVVNGPTIISSHGQVTMDQDATGGPGFNVPSLELGGDLTNQGTILARHEGAGSTDQIIGTTPAVGKVLNSGTIHVQSGRLRIGLIANSGTILVDAAGQLHSDTGGMTNTGTVTNNGDVLYAGIGTGWTQSGGAVTGNPVRIATSILSDAAGTGAFRVTGNGAKVSGTIPAGQTVTFGDPATEESDIIVVQGGGLTVASGGTLVLAPPPANGVQVTGAPLTVSGTLSARAPTAYRARIEGGMTVAAGGAVDAQPGGILELASTVTNHGRVTITPGAAVRLASSATDVFVNAADGTVDFQIASPTSFGAITRLGGEVLVLGGSANGVLTGGFAPSAGAAFKVVQVPFSSGAFGAVGGGFTASYAADKSSASLVYGGAADVPPVTPPGSGGTPAPPAPAPKPATPAKAVRCVVPNLRGLSLTAATRALKAGHCRLGTVTKPRSRRARAKAKYVVAQTRASGTKLGSKAKVGVRLGPKPKRSPKKR